MADGVSVTERDTVTCFIEETSLSQCDLRAFLEERHMKLGSLSRPSQHPRMIKLPSMLYVKQELSAEQNATCVTFKKLFLDIYVRLDVGVCVKQETLEEELNGEPWREKDVSQRFTRATDEKLDNHSDDDVDFKMSDTDVNEESGLTEEYDSDYKFEEESKKRKRHSRGNAEKANKTDEPECQAASEKKHKCQFCDEGFQFLRTLLEHYKSAHNGAKTYPCKVCPKKFSNARYLRKHSRIHSVDKGYHCEHCGKRFTAHYAVLNHIGKHHTGELPYKCDKCSKSFTLQLTLQKHIGNVHPDSKPYACESCGKMFQCPSKLELHARSHSGEKRYSCIYCPKAFVYKSAITSHLRTHTKERPYVCKVCGRSFPQQGGLKVHERRHTGEKPFSCQTCDKCFSNTEALQTHERYHSGARPFQCDDCGRTFISQQGVRNHKRTHSLVHDYSCVECNRTFSQSQGLRKHIMRNHTNLLHTCSECGKTFSSEARLGDHYTYECLNATTNSGPQ